MREKLGTAEYRIGREHHILDLPQAVLDLAGPIIRTHPLDRMVESWDLRDMQRGLLIAAAEVGLEALRQCPAAGSYENRNMGTTLTAAWCWDNQVTWVQVGDSRLYHLPVGEECARQVTTDHCMPYPHENVLTLAMSANRTLAAPIWDERGVGSFTVSKGDILILCSDGVSFYLDPEPPRARIQKWPHADMPGGQFLGQLIRRYPIDEAAQELVHCAIGMGGHDNATAIVVEVL